jgi:hypothetical protein
VQLGPFKVFAFRRFCDREIVTAVNKIEQVKRTPARLVSDWCSFIFWFFILMAAAYTARHNKPVEDFATLQKNRSVAYPPEIALTR